MNITELIVELLQNGQRVELPEIGTFDSVTQAPRHDTASGTYYPATRNVVYRPGTSGDNSIVKVIAERDCVNEEVAQQMWVNYTDALADKIKRTGEHQFGTLGTLTKVGNGFAFEMADGVVIEAGTATEKPIEGVKTYDHSGSDDPFAQFDMEEPAVTVVQRPEPVSVPEPKPEAAPEPEPIVENEEEEEEELVDEEWQEKMKQVEELPKSKAMLKAEAKAEKARLKAEAKAEKERAKLRKRAQRDHDSAERRIEEDREAMARREAEERHRAEEELRRAEQKAEEDRLRAEKEAEAALQRAEKKAEEERLKAEKRAAALAALAASQLAPEQAAAQPVNPVAQVLDAQQEAQAELEKQVAAKQKEMERAEKEAARKAQEAEKEAARQAKAAKKEAKKEKEEEKKKGRKGWLWLLLLLLLLLMAGGAYYFLKLHPRTAATSTELAGKHFDAPNVNSLTFNTDMLEYSGRDINRNTDQVCRTMADYVNAFLADQGYSNARPAMMDYVRQYADQRLNQLMGTRMAVQRFIPYDDYVYQEAEPWLRKRYAYQSRGTVQGELMEQALMDQLLNRIIDDYGIMPDNAQPATAPAQPAAQQTAAATAQTAPKKTATPDENPVYVYVEKESKQGFDIVAGFYLNKATAAKMTARLHELGCDAYIIEKNEMYYVSMGSAPTRTKAEALYKHIKSWYDGDIVIKEL